MEDRNVKRFSDKEVVLQLKSKYGKAFTEFKLVKPGVIKATLRSRDHILKICRFLKYKLNFRYPFSISAVELPDNYEVVYHLVSYENNNLIELHLPVPRDDPKVMSVVRVWKGANAHEREAYDMMGIVFETHPDLRRILLPDDVDYFPLRKDFPLEGPAEMKNRGCRLDGTGRF